MAVIVVIESTWGGEDFQKDSGPKGREGDASLIVLRGKYLIISM